MSRARGFAPHSAMARFALKRQLYERTGAPYFHNNSAATLEEVLDHYDAFFRREARLNPPPSLPPILSNGLVIDRGFVTAEERPALLAYLRKL